MAASKGKENRGQEAHQKHLLTKPKVRSYIELVIIEFTDDINTKDRITLTRTCSGAASRVNQLLPLSDVKIHFFLDDNQTILEWGVGGYCENKDQIEVALSPGRQDDWQKYLPRTIAHEWHHLARWRGPGYGTNLVEVIISEGLAQHFEIECFLGPPSFFSIVLTPEQRSQIFQSFKSELKRSGFDYSRWFFGKGEFPFQAGYDLSFAITGEYLEIKNSLASKEVFLNADHLVDTLPWLVN